MTVAVRDMIEGDVAALDALLRAAHGTSRSLEARLRIAFAAGIAGYAVARDGCVSPWLAQTPAAAASLFVAAQAALDGDTIRVSLPEDNPDAADLAAQYGWHELHRNAYMVRGVPPRFPRANTYALISLGEG
jgi:Acetyltransferase (GNAT) domain